MKLLLRIAHVIDGVSERLGSVSSFIVVLLVFVGFFNVIIRYLGRFTNSDVFGDITKSLFGEARSGNFVTEVQWYLFSLLFFLGFGYILKHGVNVRVDFLYTKWSPKRQALVDFLGTLLILIPFCILGIYVTLVPVLFSWGFISRGSAQDIFDFLAKGSFTGLMEGSPDPGGLPRAPIRSFIIVAFLLMLLQSFSQLIKYFAVLRGRTEVLQEIRADETPEAESVIAEVAERAKKIVKS